MTDNEIIKAYESLIQSKTGYIWRDVLGLLKRQKAENEVLKKNCESLCKTLSNRERVERAEAFKELEEFIRRIRGMVSITGRQKDYFDELVKETMKKQKNDCRSERMNLTEFSKEVHQNAVEHGWWEEDRSFGEVIALCHAELSEALEAYRRNHPYLYCDGNKPEGIGVELADCMLRILDFCGREGIDIEAIIRKKHEFNKTRPYKHGGKVI